jgi:Uncharacterized protein conserved in bacteria
MRFFIFFLINICILAFSAPHPSSAAFSDGGDILGLWEVEEGDGRIEIFRCADKFCGRIAWQKEPSYPIGDKGGMAGKPLLDRENPKKELRGRQQLGLVIMEGYAFRGNNLWDDGTIYNPEDGRTYKSRIFLKNRDRLQLRAFIGISLLGGSTVWKRVN